MGKVVNFPFGEEPSEERRELTEEEMADLLEGMKEGLKRLYPSQVKEVYGFVGVGQRSGKESFVGGLLFWESAKGGSAVSTFLALFRDGELEKISFLEAKKNYWDWDLMVKTHGDRFDTKKIEKEVMELRERFARNEL